MRVACHRTRSAGPSIVSAAAYYEKRSGFHTTRRRIETYEPMKRCKPRERARGAALA